MLKFYTAGESHGQALFAYISGLPAQLPIDLKFINTELHRRQLGYGRGGRQKIEQDRAEVFAGVRHGKTIGAPVALRIENRDWANWEKILPVEPAEDDPGARKLVAPRPGHADLAGSLKFNYHDARYVLEGDAARAPLGATVTIHIASQESSGLLEVPAGAIYDNGKGPGVWLIDGRASSVNFQPVRIRGLGIETALLSNGVTARERIVALGAWQLHQGEKVRIAETRNIAQ